MRKAKAKKKKLKSIPVKTINKIIAWAWDDKTSFDQIQKEFNLTEQEVIELMRMQLKPSSWRLWRKRVSGRVSKHAKKFLEYRQGSTKVSLLNNSIDIE